MEDGAVIWNIRCGIRNIRMGAFIEMLPIMNLRLITTDL